MSLSTKRWLILLAGLVANVCQSIGYTASIFMLPLGEALARPKAEWSREWAFIFAMNMSLVPLGMILLGKLADRGLTKLTIVMGALLYGGGVLLASTGGSVLWTAVTLGAMPSLGSGFCYGTIVGAALRWFPDRRGLASGLTVAALGAGPILLAPVTRWLIAEYGVLVMFRILALTVLPIMLLAALFIVNPPADYVPSGWTPPASAAPGGAAPAGGLGCDWKQMLAQPLFWLIYASNFCGVFSGVVVSGLAVPIAIELAGFSPAEAALPVMVFSLANASGRIIWGSLSDRVGRVVMIGVAFVLTGAAMFTLFGHVRTPGVYLPCLFVAGICYGGVFGTYPSLVTDSFGVRNAALNFAVFFTSFSCGALLAPQVAAHYRAGGVGEYPKAFLISGCVAVVGFVLSIVVGRLIARRRGGAV